MWPFKSKKDTEARARDKPDFGAFRPVFRVRGDCTLTTSEAIYAAVSRISDTMAMLPMHLYKGWEIQHDDEREKLVSYMPNGTMTPYKFQQTMEAFRNTEGNAYALMVPDNTGTRIERLDVLDASQVETLRETDTREIYYRFRLDDGTTATVHSSSMIALQHLSANGEKGIRPIDVLRGSIDYNKQISEFSLKQLEGVNSGVVLNIPGTGLSPERKNKVIDQFLDAYRRSGGRLVVLEGGITATTLTQSPVDSRVMDVERITKNRVATVYRIPPHMLGDYTDATYSTAEQSKREYMDLTILPIVKQWEDEFNLKLLTWKERSQGYAFRFDMTEMLRADVATMAEANQKAIRGGWKTINEVRKMDSLPPVDMGGELLASRDLAPLSLIVNQKAGETI